MCLMSFSLLIYCHQASLVDASVLPRPTVPITHFRDMPITLNHFVLSKWMNDLIGGTGGRDRSPLQLISEGANHASAPLRYVVEHRRCPLEEPGPAEKLAGARRRTSLTGFDGAGLRRRWWKFGWCVGCMQNVENAFNLLRILTFFRVYYKHDINNSVCDLMLRYSSLQSLPVTLST